MKSSKKSKKVVCTSSQAADMIAGSSASAAAAVTFGGSTQTANIFAHYGASAQDKGMRGESALTMIQSSRQMSSLDMDMSLALKKLTKTDSLTKQRGLTDLIQLVSTRPPDTACAVLGGFCSSFGRLAVLDSDRRTRELTYNCLEVICSKVGKRATEYLKIVLPHWLTGLHDSTRETAIAARKAFDSLVNPSHKKKKNTRVSFLA
eukprot:GHVR01122692.1.p1 GENE.GHVR01122692.1~~GHVR01122692.1.p1  ORF type:complete len:205 (+),score=45.56 GHVR01122692.1:161-775(+)